MNKSIEKSSKSLSISLYMIVFAVSLILVIGCTGSLGGEGSTTESTGSNQKSTMNNASQEVVSVNQESVEDNATQTTDNAGNIQISFKLDSQLTSGLYMGDRWVSPPTFDFVQEGDTFTVEVKAEGFDENGQILSINPEWIPEDPDMVKVMPSQGNMITITIQRAGESSLQVSSQMGSKTLSIQSSYQNNAIRVTILQ